MRFQTLIIVVFLFEEKSANIHKKLQYYETLKTLDISSRTKRSTSGSLYPYTKEVAFETLGRKFNLVLHPGSPVLASDFKAKVVNADGSSEIFHVDQSNFFTGYLADDKYVSVNAHFEDGILSTTIKFPNETYAIEPAWRHLPVSNNHTMIAYRESDVNWNEIFPDPEEPGQKRKFKDGIHLYNEEQSKDSMPEFSNQDIPLEHGNDRNKRQAGVKNTCPLLVIADYNFYKNIGDSKRTTTAHYIIGVIQSVHQRFSKTVWDAKSGFVNYGLQIKEMKIHTAYSDESGHYNEWKQQWDTVDILVAFSRSDELNNFCLGHLFTSHSFAGNVLGLAFIASENVWDTGGICSMASQFSKKRVIPRTGWSSSMSSGGYRLLSMHFELVVTHEIGHNWGSEHDPDNYMCGPSSQDNGKYIMWPYAVNGWERNNVFFSPCSINNIAPVLKSKSQLCFTVTSEPVCGNAVIEKGEECDAGFVHDQEDPCCSSNCKLKHGAFCSDINYECCTNCQMSGIHTLCASEFASVCLNESFCSGRSLFCPKPPPAANGTRCIDMGKCYDGKCLSYCETLGLEKGKLFKPCLCEMNTTAACMRCCMEISSAGSKGECLPTKEKLPEGRTCYIGYCNAEGLCIQTSQEMIQRLFHFIKHLSVSKLGAFMRTNIVGTVIVLSLIIWIPLGCIISSIDQREMRKAKYIYKQQAYKMAMRSVLITSEHLHIKKSRHKKIPHGKPQKSGLLLSNLNFDLDAYQHLQNFFLVYRTGSCLSLIPKLVSRILKLLHGIF